MVNIIENAKAKGLDCANKSGKELFEINNISQQLSLSCLNEIIEASDALLAKSSVLANEIRQLAIRSIRDFSTIIERQFTLPYTLRTIGMIIIGISNGNHVV